MEYRNWQSNQDVGGGGGEHTRGESLGEGTESGSGQARVESREREVQNKSRQRKDAKGWRKLVTREEAQPNTLNAMRRGANPNRFNPDGLSWRPSSTRNNKSGAQRKHKDVKRACKEGQVGSTESRARTKERT